MTDPAAVRELFLEPRPAYTLAEVAAMLAMSGETVRAWVEAGELEAAGENGRATVPWSELAGFAMDFWEQEEVEAALGADVAWAIPVAAAGGPLGSRSADGGRGTGAGGGAGWDV